MAWTITWQPAIRERFESLLGEIGPEVSKSIQGAVQEAVSVLPPDSDPNFLFVTVRGVTLECGVDPVSQTADVRGVALDEQS